MGRFVLVFGVAALLLASCGSDEDAAPSGDVTDSPWRATQYLDAGGTLTAPTEGAILSAHFDGEEVAGSAGCNNYFGAYTTDGDTIDIGPLASTQMFCEFVMDQEMAYLTAMQSADTFEVSGETLELRQGDTVLVVYEAASVELADTSWNVLAMLNYTDGFASVLNGTDVTIDFGADGGISGSTGCNEYSGTYEVDGDAIVIGTLAVTERACLEPEGAMEQETIFLDRLQGAATFAIVDDELTLFDTDGNRLLTASLT
jgi:heat shock protein HslJ